MKLYIIHVGFYDLDIGMYELHSNVLTIAPDAKTAKQQVKNKDFFINKKMHIDGIQEIINVDGYDLIPTPNSSGLNNTIFSHEQIKAL